MRNNPLFNMQSMQIHAKQLCKYFPIAFIVIFITIVLVLPWKVETSEPKCLSGAGLEPEFPDPCSG